MRPLGGVGSIICPHGRSKGLRAPLGGVGVHLTRSLPDRGRGRGRPETPDPGRWAGIGTALLQQRENALRLGIGLREDGHARLLQDLRAR